MKFPWLIGALAGLLHIKETIGAPLFVMSSQVETSLNVSANGPTTEIVRDFSTSVGMTKTGKRLPIAALVAGTRMRQE